MSWTINDNPKSMPPAISRRLKGLNHKIDSIDVDQNKLIEQITLINDATEAAESLPADLADLKNARKNVKTVNEEAIKTSAKIEGASQSALELLNDMKALKVEADKIVDNCEDAYRISTSKGLSGAFEQRAKELTKSMWIWVGGLLGSLLAAWFVGSTRISMLSEVMSQATPDWGVIVMHLLLTSLSVGAPLWFAWLSTKQIGERFKLAEDYGFKASAAKGYEGYRKEASRIDGKLEARLFESALARFDEAPLRLIEKSSHGSPWHEIADSSGFKSALKNIPEFRDKIWSLVQSEKNSSTKKADLHVVDEQEPKEKAVE
jgi:hypothetical protein